MKKIVVTIPMNNIEKNLIESLATSYEVLYLKAQDISKEILNDCEILLGNVSPALLKENKSIKWVHLNSAGVNSYIDVISPETTLTNSTGAYDLALAEHTLAMIFALQKKLQYYIRNQENCLWKDEGKVKSIFNSKVLIIGLGNIGKELGKKLNLLGANVSGVKKNISECPNFIEKIYSLDSLDEILNNFDIVISVLPETPETLNLFDLEKFKKMSKDSIFINIGRGTTVSSDDLYIALKDGIISGAGLDVTHIEPLPKEHKLWSCQNLILTPHIAGGYHLDYTLEKIVDLALENLKSYLTNKPLKNIVDSKRGY